MRVSYAASALFLASSILLSAQTSSTEHAPVVLVELFTSEGCSSCPPADDLLRQIHGKQTPYGQRVIGVSEHVTYWNRLGWKDPYSAQTFTDRQEAYGARFKLDSVYTPQMVINGEEQVVGSDSAALNRILQHQAGRPQIDLRIVSTDLKGGNIMVHFTAHRVPAKLPLEIVAVVADDVDQSHVSRGENSGRTLQHVSVARRLVQVATIDGDTDRTFPLPLLRDDAVEKRPSRHLILIAQEPSNGKVTGADSAPLP